MHWQTEQDKQTLVDFRAHNRRVSELKRDLWEFKMIQENGDPIIRSWALQMIKSVEHELHQIES